MSEKIKEIPSTTKVHTFFCDDCGAKLMESVECDDGWCRSPKTMLQNIFVESEHKWYHYPTKFLCDDCMRKEANALLAGLKNLGFEEGLL